MQTPLMTRAGALAVAAFTCLSLAACGGSPASTDNGSAAAGSTGSADEVSTFIVGFDQSYPPYGFVGDDGEFTGFDLDLAAEVCNRNGWELQLEPIDWDANTDPYMLNGQVIVVRADSGISSWDDLAGKTVITQVDSAALDVLEGDQADLAATFASLEQIGDYNTAFMQLESGAVDAVACDLSIAAYQMSANPDAYVQLDDMLSSEHYAVGFAKDNQELADQVTETLRAMDEDGFVEELCDTYAEYGISYDNWVLE